ncbi:MFS transporter [Sporolactobacillus sp. STCC-11]|uniref:MFS transporter n=1 Tax=Sporolactobacillus caesalpiniae TaxID=3230362 RepID=UPI003392F2E0
MDRIFSSLKKRTWWILFGYTISLFGTGLTDPFLILYLHQLRAFSLSLSGLVIGTSGFAGAVAIPISGLLIDRFGEKRAFLSALIMSALGRIAYAGASRLEWAFLAAVLSGAGAAAAWNALSVVLANLVKKTQRASIFGVAFALQNMGLGLGSAFSGLLFQTHHLIIFQMMFFCDAATYVLFTLFAYGQIEENHKQLRTRYKFDMRYFSLRTMTGHDQALLLLSFGYFVIGTVMTGITSTLFPQWVTVQARASTNIVGQAFLANSIVIVLGQVIVLKIMKNKRRTRVLAASVFIFAAGYSMIFISGFAHSKAASLALISALSVTAVGETLLFSTVPALANELAPMQAKGRYNSVINTAWQMDAIIGPMVTGIGLGMHQDERLLLLSIMYSIRYTSSICVSSILVSPVIIGILNG